MALTVAIKVIPSSGRQKFVLEPSGQLKCFIKSSPEKGKANRELIKLIAKVCGVLEESVTIPVGAISRKKVVKVETDMSYVQFLQKLGFDHQQPLV